MSLIDASRLNTQPLVYQVEDFLPESGAGFFWGPSGSGKTFTILDLALAVATGQKFMGRETLPGTVVYMAGEASGGIGVRVKARLLRQQQDDTAKIAEVARARGDEAARAYAASLPPYTSDNLKVRTESFPMHFEAGNKPNLDLTQVMNELRVLNTPPPQADGQTREDYEEMLRTWPYLRLVILDALENFTGTKSVSHRNSANMIVNTMQWMAAQLQCCVLAVAHPVGRGDTEKMVGSDRLKAAADFVIRYAPDTVAAPGALDTATISCEKSKDDKKFDAFGVELHPCEWDEPKLDEEWNPVPLLDEETGEQAADANGNPLWETVKVTSQTVRLIEQAAAVTPPPEPARPVMPPPELRDNRPQSRVRPILRPLPRERNGLHVVPDLPDAVPVPESVLARKRETNRINDERVTPPAIVPPPGPASAKQELARALLAVRCPVCSRPASMGCDARMTPAPLPLARTDAGQAYIHEDRILAAAVDQPDPEGFLSEAIATLSARTAPPKPAPAPAPKRLSWTSVTPDSAAPTLAELGLAGH